jgi:site-specific recombinase XerD
MVTPEHIEEHLARRPLSPASTRVELENLRAFFRWCHQDQRLIRRNPCDGVARVRVPEKIRASVSPADFDRLVGVCQNPEERLLVEVLYRTGLRLNEFRSLTWERIDFTRRRIPIRGKGGHERMVFWREREIAAFESHWQRAGYLLAYRDGPWGEMRIERTLHRLGREAELPFRLTAHVLRHGWFRAGKRRGLSLEVLARVGGHKDVSTTAKMYSPMDADDLQAVYETGG